MTTRRAIDSVIPSMRSRIFPEVPTARELTRHRVNGLNEALRIFVLDAPSQGGACHEYVILIPVSEQTAERRQQDERDREDSASDEESANQRDLESPWTFYIKIDRLSTLYLHRNDLVAMMTYRDEDPSEPVDLEFFNMARVKFQNGPIKEHGVNGLSQEALLAVLIDRLEGFQSGQFKCRDNEVALTHIESAALWLHKRTLERVARNVEGTHQR